MPHQRFSSAPRTTPSSHSTAQSLLLNSEPRTAQLPCAQIGTIDISAFILISAPWRALHEALLHAYSMTQAMIFSLCGPWFSCIMEIKMPRRASLLLRVIIPKNQSKSAMNVTFTNHLNVSQLVAFRGLKKKSYTTNIIGKVWKGVLKVGFKTWIFHFSNLIKQAENGITDMNANAIQPFKSSSNGQSGIADTPCWIKPQEGH